MQRVLPSGAGVVVLALVLSAAVTVADAGVSPLWLELGGSASGNGVSQTPSPAVVLESSVAVGGDRLPVVAYTEYPDAAAAQGAIRVKRWTGAAWETLDGGGGIGQGYAPQVRISPGDAIHVAWLQDDVNGGTEIHLRVRTATTFDELGGSDSPGGVSGSNPAITAPFSLALDAGGNPLVAFLGLVQNGVTRVTRTPELIDGTAQVYVRRWTGSAWQFLGSDFTGGGASTALSFVNAAGETVVHDADAPALAVDGTGAPVVAFTYSTTVNVAPAANTDVYVTRWNGAAWTAVGPAVPAGDTTAGNGGAGGVSNSITGSFNPSLAADATGRLALAWEENATAGATSVRVRVWNGATWGELAGSATGSGFTQPGTLNLSPQVALDAAGRPVVAWRGLADPAAPSQVFVLHWNGSDAWAELGLDSAGNAGISDARLDVLAPSLALTPSRGSVPAGAPTVGWLDVRATGFGQVFLRQHATPVIEGTSATGTVRLTVAVKTPVGTVGQGAVGTISGPAGTCGIGGTGNCTADLAAGTPVVLVAVADPGNRFLSWSGGPCHGRTNATCQFTLTANASTTALFRGITGVQVLKPGNGTGTVTGIGFSCGADCFEEVFTGLARTLTPAAATGSRFMGWSGDVCNGQASGLCTFTTLGLNQSISATFTLTRHSLAVTNRLNGSVVNAQPLPGPVTIDCGNGNSACGGVFDWGTPVVLQATPVAGFAFVSWSGVTCAGGATNATCAFPLRANVTVTPSYRARTLVSVVKAGTGAGLVTGLGISCGLDCGHPAFDGKPVKLTAAPATGSRFLGFSGGCVSNTSTCTFLPVGNSQTVTATFQLIPYTVTLTPRVNGGVADLNALPDPVACGAGGTDCTTTLDFGTQVILRATPIVGSRFVKWTGGVCNGLTNATCSFRIPARNVSVAPTFRDVTALSLNKSGMGTITSTPAGIACGLACSAAVFDFARGVVVKLTATPAIGWSFAGFSGDCTGGACAVNASAPTAFVGAAFTIQKRRLQVGVVGNGSVTGVGLACDPATTPCGVDYDYGTLVPLTPVAPPGHRFVGWSGSCLGTGACTALMTLNRSVTATFRPVFTLTVTKAGNSTGTITGTGIKCGTDCGETYLNGTLVTLTRSAPITGTVFRWLGDCAFRGTNATCALAMNANASVIAEYKLKQFGLTVKKVGPQFGTVSAVTGSAVSCGGACTDVIDYGTPVILLATPSANPASEFVSWAGCATVANTSCSFTMTANRTVTATFSPLVSAVMLQAASTGPLGVGGTRQLMAIATFTDGSQQDVTTQATWVSSPTTVATVSTTGLVTGRAVGNASVTATFRTVTSAPLAVQVDTLQSIAVSCQPYGDASGNPARLACLPSGLSFEVHCRALGRFAGSPGVDVDITDQVAWVASNTLVARSTGRIAFSGPIRQSFRIVGAGTARLFAKQGARSSPSTTGVLGIDPWVVQGVAQTLSGAPQITPDPANVTVGNRVQLQAMASFNPTAACPAPPPRDFALLVGWGSTNDLVADVSFFGEVTGVSPGSVTISATYGIMLPDLSSVVVNP